MAKDTLWFPHDYNARADEKTAALINDHGALGYGIFQIITEILHEEEEGRIIYDEKKLRRLAATCRTGYDVFKQVVDDCIHHYELWVLEDGYFFSVRVIRNKADREEIRNKKRENGKKGGLVRKSQFEANALKNQANALKNQANALKNQAPVKQNQANPSTGQDITGHNSNNSSDEELYKNENVFVPTAEQQQSFEKFCLWMQDNAPSVLKMEKPLTCHELLKLRGLIPDSKGKKSGISKERCMEIILSLENNKQYLKRYRSPYLCILAWHRRELK